MIEYEYNGIKYNFDARIHSSVKIPRPDLVHIYGGDTTIIDENCLIGPFVEIQSNVKVGKNTRIQSHSFICSGVEIGENSFIGHGVMTINDKYPKSNNKNWTCLTTLIGNNCNIGSNSTIMPVKIDDNVTVGAGSVVTKDVKNNKIVYGVPAK